MSIKDWIEAEDVLCVRSDSLGDVLMTTPAIRAVKEAGDGRQVTLLTSSSGAAVARLVPEVDDVIRYDAPWGNLASPRHDSRPEQEMIAQLRQRKFDAAVIFTVYSQNPLPAAMLCYLADIPLRLAHCRENPYQLLTDWLPEPEPEKRLRHEVRRQLDLVAAVGYRTNNERLSLQLPQYTYGRLFSLLSELGLNLDQKWVVIHPGVTAASRRYPPPYYARVARLLAQEHGWQILFTGTEPELGLVQGIREAMIAPSYSLVSRLDLAEMAALLSISPLLITNNTGPAHMAAAVGTPVVDLYALTNPQHTPWQVPNRVLFHDVPCKYCYRSVCPEGHHHCLRLVTPETVVAAAVELAAETAGTIQRPLPAACLEMRCTR